MKNKKINTVIIGASGYTGRELVRILLKHPNAAISQLVADSNAGKEFSAIYPEYANQKLPKLCKLGEVDWSGADVVFCCLPHATSQEVIASLPKNLVIIDLSADFRITDVDVYEKWYKHKHSQPELQKTAVYGLSEIYRDKIKQAKLIANPGCYPTSILLPLIPLLEEKIISPENIIIDSKSGYSGAGAKADELKKEVQDSIKVYGLEGHRHIAEIEQELTTANGKNKNIVVSFTPHALQIFRGMTSNINVQLAKGKTIDDVRKCLAKKYSGCRFVKLISGSEVAAPKSVNFTNDIQIGVYADRLPGRIKITTAIDNLLKGASGQAIQNMNIIFGFDEGAGLEKIMVYENEK